MKKKLKKILIKTKRQVFSEIVGNNASLFKGEGYDFVELREYLQGDDIRKIDWIITAKLQKPYVKIFQEERELNIIVASMLDGNTFFGTKRLKQDIMAEIVSILGLSAIKNKDMFSYYTFADRHYETIRPTKNIFSVYSSIEKTLEFSPYGKQANYKTMIDTLFKRVKRKSIIFIVADFLNPFDLRLLSKKHEVIAIIVRDRFEENPKALGYTSLVDPSSKKSLFGFIDKKKTEQFSHNIAIQDKKNSAHFKKNRIKYTKIYTDDEPFIKLLKLFGSKS